MAGHIPYNNGLNKYQIHMNSNPGLDYSAAATATISTVRSAERVVFWLDGSEVGTLDWEQGHVRFQGNVDQSAEQLAVTASGKFHEVTQALESEIQQSRAWLAYLLSLLNKEQFEDTSVQAVLDYLHKHEFFENLIRGR